MGRVRVSTGNDDADDDDASVPDPRTAGKPLPLVAPSTRDAIGGPCACALWRVRGVFQPCLRVVVYIDTDMCVLRECGLNDDSA